MNKTPGLDLTTKEAEKLLAWRNSWESGPFDSYKGLGVQVFAEMIGDAKFRKLVMKQLQLPKGLRRAERASNTVRQGYAATNTGRL